MSTTIDTYFPQTLSESAQDAARLNHIENLFLQWIRFQPNLPNNFDRNMLRNFIRGTNYSFERTKYKFGKYLHSKCEFSPYFSARNPNDAQIQLFMSRAIFCCLPNLTADGNRVHIFNAFQMDANDFDLVLACKVFFMHYDFLLTQSAATQGEIAVIDCSDFSPQFFQKFISAHFRNGVNILRDSYAVKVKFIHLINPPQLIEKVIQLIGPLIHHKVKDRIICHKSFDTLANYLDTNILPLDFGGTHPTPAKEQTQIWFRMLQDNCQWFQQQDLVQMRNKIKNDTKQQGLAGSFRKLDID